METSEKLSWSALEYEERERSRDWFWALGVIVITSSIASIIFNNYFFAALIIISGLLLGFFAVRKPDTVIYEFNAKGLKIRNRVYLYENMKAFWVQLEVPQNPHIPPQPREWKPMLFIKSERAFMPIISMPIDAEMAHDIHSLLISENVTEEEMKEHPSEKIMEALGF